MFANLSIVALFAGLAAAYHAPVGEPSGNPITRPLNELVPAGETFQITWTPTTTNKVSLVFLKGPSTNVIPQYAIAEAIPNSGSFAWKVDSALAATAGPNGYGIQIIDDVTGQYQYSTQFGFSNAKPVESVKPVESSKPAESKPTASVAPNASGYAAVSAVPTTIKTSAVPTSSPCTTTTAYVPAGTGSVKPPTNGTVPSYPTALPPKPSAPVGGNTTAPFFPGAASGLQAGLGFAGAAAALAMLL